jgi:hypothetical protein
MYERIVWQYWENSDTYPNSIPYIDLCHETVDLHQTDGKGYKVIRLNDKNYHEYIDDINPFIYPIESLGIFRTWLNSEYLPQQFPNYLQRKVKQGAIPATSAELLLRAVIPKELE